MNLRERIARWLSPLLNVALRSRTTVKFFLFPVLVLPFANFILDTTFTLFRRLIRREKWYQAHRSHFYQRMTDLGVTHGKVTSIELLVGSRFWGSNRPRRAALVMRESLSAGGLSRLRPWAARYMQISR